ncbi:MAG: histidine kinase [Lewinellaceae bacterium]|nr:histidine kinase [Lewinellaceae bacterium]
MTPLFKPSSCLLLFLWALLFPLALPAQYHLTKTYMVQDGLPMTEVGRTFISRAGYLYLMTTTGHRLVYDGFRFREFGKGEVASNSTDNQSILEDQYGVWMLNGGNLYRYVAQEEVKVAYPPFKTWFLDEGNDRIVLMDGENRLLVFNPESRQFEPDAVLTARRAAYGRDTYYYRGISKFGKYWELVMESSQGELAVYEWEEGKKGKRRMAFAEGLVLFYPLSAEVHLLGFPEKGKGTQNREYYVSRAGGMTPLEGMDWKERRRQFVGYGFSAVQGRVLLHGTPPPEIAQSDEETEIWEVDASGRSVFLARFSLPAALGVPISQPDAAGNFWLPSQGGLVKVFPAFLGCFQSNPNMASGLHAISEDAAGDIWFGFYRHGFSKFDGDKIIPVPPSSIPFPHIMPGSWRDEQGWMYFFNERGYGFFKTNGRDWEGITKYKSGENELTGGYFLPVSNGQRLALGLYRNLGLGLMDYPFEPGKPMHYVDSAKGMELINVLTIAEDRAGRIWFGRASQGLGVYDPKLDTAVTWLISDKGRFGAISSQVDTRGNLWLGTRQGLAVLPAPHELDFLQQNANDYIQLLNLPEAGPEMVIFLKEHQGYLCFGNNIGFGLLDLGSYYDNPGNPRVHFFNTADYLPGGSSEQNAVLVDRKGNIWMGNDQGAIRLALDRLVLDTGAIRLDSLFFLHGRNERSEASDGLLKLPRGQRGLSFFWSSTFDGQLLPNRWLSYRLILASGDTLQQSDYLLKQEVSLGYVPPGEHRLEFTLYKDNQKMEHRSIRLFIPKNLEDTWWFWALISAFLVFAVSAILWLRYTQKRQQQRYELAAERLKREKEALQIQAITSSLNPHFLNNTLHWVQAKVRRDEVASSIIDKLAENIRTVFQRSRNREAFHSLFDEMEMVRNYLSIQHRRFNGRYQFTLPSEEEVMLYRHIMLPLMQILIHAENAVEHGLRNRKGSSFLRITLKDEGPYLKIVVEDDGIGYSNARKKNIGGTRQGERMLNSLHDIFNPRNVRKIISNIEDNIYLDQDSGEGYGTRISILIPKRFNYELETDRGSGSRR